jgi:hypothetical protein
MIENLAAAASDPAFRKPILPGCLHTCTFRLKTRCLQEGNHIGIEFRVVVEDGITIPNRVGKCFTQLLHNPISGRMTSNVEMQNPASAMLDYEEAIQELECQGGHREQVEGDDHLAVILEEGQPALTGITPTTNSPQVSSHGPFRQLETELLQFSVDLWGTPARILFCHLADEPSNLLANLWPTAARPGTPAPVPAEARAMPADDGLGPDNNENFGPARPELQQYSPKQPIQSV